MISFIKLLLNWSSQKLNQTAFELGISIERMGYIIKVLVFHKVFATCVLCMLSDDIKAKRAWISWKLLKCFEEGEDFLKIIIIDDTWFHNYDLEDKKQFMKYCHKKPSQPKLKKLRNSKLKLLLGRSFFF